MSLSTFVSVIILFLSIIFFTLVFSRKPNQSQVKEMQETGWEIVNELKNNTEDYMAALEKEKKEIDEKLKEMKKIRYEIYRAKRSDSNGNVDTNAEIISMYQSGYTVEDISKLLSIQKGVVEVSLNMGKIKKHG